MILLAGASGMLGGAIARELQSGNGTLRALVRSHEAAKRLQGLEVTAVFGDLKDPASLAQACGGVDIVITTASAMRRSGADTIESVDVQGSCDLIDAAIESGVKRFVYVSAYGASMHHAASILAAKAYVEAYLRSSSLTWTILAPNLFMDIWVERVVGEPVRTGKAVTLVGDGLRRHSMVAVEDVARIAVCAINDAAADEERISIGGPAAISWRDVVAAYERAYATQVRVVRSDSIPGMPASTAGLLHGLEAFDSPIDMAPLAKRYDLELTSIDAYAARSASAGR